MYIIKCLTSSILVDGLIWLFVIKRKDTKLAIIWALCLKKIKIKKQQKGVDM